MNSRAVQLILVVALVAIAGCAGGTGGTPESNSPTDDSSTTDSSDGGTGTAAFYISDEPNVIDDFEHLNVTITSVEFKRTGDLSDGDANGTDGDATENESDDGESTNETSDDGTADEGTTADANEENETDGDQADGADERWITYDVDNETVDLTELKGANASMIDEFELPAGEYETVRLSVSETEGVLTDGSTTRVKLPSKRLKLQTTFTVGNGERVDFVYDIAPHKAGKSGKYVLKPVIGQSGTGDDVEIRDVDKEKGDDEKGDKRRGNGNAGEKRAEAA